MSTTFHPHANLSVAGRVPELPQFEWRGRIEQAAPERIYQGTLCNGFVDAFALAYNEHLPLVLSPDVVWHQICVSAGQVVNADPERFRDALGIEHEGRKTLFVYRDEFVLGSPDNDWPGVFTSFKRQIAAYAPLVDELTRGFTTSTELTQVAAAASMMDLMQNYFEYRMRTMCGFPEVTLLGTPEDWSALRSRTESLLTTLGQDEWLVHLGPVLAHFEAAAVGQPDLDFWQRAYRKDSGSGGPYINGWVCAFFPLYGGRPNPYLDWEKRRSFGGMTEFPSTVSTAPVVWEYYGREINLEFRAGLAGVEFDGAVSPAFSWAVVHADD